MSQNYTIYQQLVDDRLGEVMQLQGYPQDQDACVKTERFENLKAFKSRLRDLQERKEMNSKYQIPLYEITYHTEKAALAESYIIKSIYHYPENDLELEIGKRKSSGQFFKATELIHMAYQILHGLRDMHERLETFDDLSPMHIEWQDGTFYNIHKIVDSLQNRDSNILTVQNKRILKNRRLYCSPEIFDAICQKSTNFGDLRKNDTWALGMCLMEAGTLTTVQNVYDVQSRKIDQLIFRELVMLFFRRYQEDFPLLTKILDYCLIPDPKSRPTPNELLEQLQPYDDICKEHTDVRIIEMRQQYINSIGSDPNFQDPKALRNTRLVNHYTINEMLGIQPATLNQIFPDTDFERFSKGRQLG